MAALTDGSIRKAIGLVANARKQKTLADGEGHGTGRLSLILKPMPSRVTAEWYAVQWRDGKRAKSKLGDYPSTTLAKARELFQRDYADPIQKGVSIKLTTDTRPGTVADLFEAYPAALRAQGKRSADHVEKELKKIGIILGVNREAREITAEEVIEVTPAIATCVAPGKHSLARLAFLRTSAIACRTMLCRTSAPRITTATTTWRRNGPRWSSGTGMSSPCSTRGVGSSRRKRLNSMSLSLWLTRRTKHHFEARPCATAQV